MLNFEFDNRCINLKDKGYLGKLVKLSFFGLSFNENYNFPIITLILGYVILKNKKQYYICKKRLTLGNIKDLDKITNCNRLEELDTTN